MSDDKIIDLEAYKKANGLPPKLGTAVQVGVTAQQVIDEARLRVSTLSAPKTAMVRSYVREWRLHRGMTIRQLADMAGCYVGVISRIERHDRELSVPLMLSLTKALRIEIGDLFEPPAGDSASAS